jgi:hypothetical protein
MVRFSGQLDAARRGASSCCQSFEIHAYRSTIAVIQPYHKIFLLKGH